jgi:hypothetical protein
MIVASTIFAVAVVGLMAGLSGVTRNASRLREYDRAVQLARLRMNDLLADVKLPRNTEIDAPFDPQITGGVQAGWRAKVTTAEVSPIRMMNDFALDRIDLEVWWMAGDQRRILRVEGYRRRLLTAEDVAEERK